MTTTQKIYVIEKICYQIQNVNPKTSKQFKIVLEFKFKKS